MIKAFLIIVCVFIASYAFASQCGFIGGQYYCLQPAQSGDINWSSLNSDIKSTGINWTSVNGSAQVNTGAINWSSINSLAKVNAAGINWTNMISTYGVNWYSEVK